MSGMSTLRREVMFLFGINSVVLSLVIAEVSSSNIADVAAVAALVHGVALCARVAIQERRDS